MDDSYTIGTVARLAAVGTETIRFYERKGLIQAPPRNGSGYRVYRADVVDHIRFIRDARELGFSLAQIQTLLRGHDKEFDTCQVIKDLLVDKARDIEEQQKQIEKAKQTLEQLIRNCPATGECSSCRVAKPVVADPHKP